MKHVSVDLLTVGRRSFCTGPRGIAELLRRHPKRCELQRRGLRALRDMAFQGQCPATSLAMMGYTQVSPDIVSITFFIIRVFIGSEKAANWITAKAGRVFAYEQAERSVTTHHVPEEISTTTVSLKRVITMRGDKKHTILIPRCGVKASFNRQLRPQKGVSRENHCLLSTRNIQCLVSEPLRQNRLRSRGLNEVFSFALFTAIGLFVTLRFEKNTSGPTFE